MQSGLLHHWVRSRRVHPYTGVVPQILMALARNCTRPTGLKRLEWLEATKPLKPFNLPPNLCSKEARHSLSHMLFMPVTESWKLSKPHAHCTVPAPKTKAPLLALYLSRCFKAQSNLQFSTLLSVRDLKSLTALAHVPKIPKQLITRDAASNGG